MAPGPTGLDQEAAGMIQVLSRIPPHQQAEFERQIRDRMSMVRAGAGRMAFMNHELRTLDPLLRARLCYETGNLLIERWAHAWGFWAIVYIWQGDGFGNPIRHIIRTLQHGDMQRPGWREEKRRRAATARRAHERASDDKVKAAVDSLPAKSLRQFAEVEQARNRGERLIHHGEDLKFMERTHERARKTGVYGEAGLHKGGPINPGHHPSVHRRPNER